MPASLRELRERRRSVQTTKKITRAMELIAASRIVKAQQAAQESLPYTRELNRAVAAVASFSGYDHPLTREEEHPTRAAVLIVTADRGLAGAYSTNAIKLGDRLISTLREEGKEVQVYITGRKGIGYYQFRGREVAQSWHGFSDRPTHRHSDEVADALIKAFLTPTSEGGVDEIHAVYTRMESMLVQEPRVRRILPLRVVRDAVNPEPVPEGPLPLYEFEPDPVTVLNALLPLYVRNRIHFYLMQAAASELASKQKAMKSATDNAEQLIQKLIRDANQARQSQITQEITEIVGGASALAESNDEE
ncbi:MAG TPA: F0F1 ATP synthase subunit gamma [Propionibacteriaceae bacterium]|nr:F0F1 ATP synthase subunit gamma [Propionibacteriaceae bacterium]